MPKIRQVDELLLDGGPAQAKIKEVHPEVCLWSLAGGKPMLKSKKKAGGFAERLRLLASVYPPAEELVNRALLDFSRNDVGRDDIVDALAAAITALLGNQGLSTIPVIPEFDSRGLPMQMLYLSWTKQPVCSEWGMAYGWKRKGVKSRFHQEA